MELRFNQHTMRLLPQRMIWWPEQSTLILSDMHLGKAATFRKAGIPVPGGTTGKMLGLLGQQLQKWKATRVVVVGDLFHSHIRDSDGYEADLERWRLQHRQLQVVLVRGNHDRGHQRLMQRLKFEVAEEEFVDSGIRFVHDPLSASASQNEEPQWTISGHVHPAIRINDLGAPRKLPAFWLMPQHLVLPSFGEFTGTATIKPGLNDRVFVVADDMVLEATALVHR